nr:hypothetical protein [Caldimonas sp.]
MVSAALLVACGGTASDATIGGTLSGLGTGLSVVVQDNGGDTTTLVANGPFQFPTLVAAGASYSVTVLTQPIGQTCAVGNASGTVNATDNVTNVTLACAASASLTGTVSGLAAGTSVTLGNGSVQLPIAANGTFAFPGLLAAGTIYSVTVVVQPAGEQCTVTNGQGTVPASGLATPIAVACS